MKHFSIRCSFDGARLAVDDQQTQVLFIIDEDVVELLPQDVQHLRDWLTGWLAEHGHEAAPEAAPDAAPDREVSTAATESNIARRREVLLELRRLVVQEALSSNLPEAQSLMCVHDWLKVIE